MRTFSLENLTTYFVVGNTVCMRNKSGKQEECWNVYCCHIQQHRTYHQWKYHQHYICHQIVPYLTSHHYHHHYHQSNFVSNETQSTPSTAPYSSILDLIDIGNNSGSKEDHHLIEIDSSESEVCKMIGTASMQTNRKRDSAHIINIWHIWHIWNLLQTLISSLLLSVLR